MIALARTFAASLLLGLASVACAQSSGQASAPTAPPATVTEPPKGFAQAIVLWPNGAPGAHGTGEGDVPKLFSYPAPGAAPHPAVVVLPGGSYSHLVMEKEGAVEARWLNERGVSAYVLEYRLGPAYRFPAPMLDGARAIRYLRSHAVDFALDPGRIGVWGFSAGGHLAGYLAAVHDAGDPAAQDPIDRQGDRPDFAILSYARVAFDKEFSPTPPMGDLIGKDAAQSVVDSIWVERLVTKDASPSFIYSTTGDQTVDARNSTAYYDALKRAGVPAELHIFERGPHGTGMAQTLAPALDELKIWPLLLEHWMTQNGWMPIQR
ncbi:Acetyl esterase/lipase [Granulicella rosea]|uniref:Acetyl esterase/lipase n=1 Tax=Granulicella rosea TaxID=474952 RepID=A0A239MEW4_9BACT|nr:alpha/beta hydrolase [Granulicella rosea]SNT40329.1 Acetyl esterase/lipase [Granulicella rosea]